MATSENMSRKRPAPGTSPLGYQSQAQQGPNSYTANPAQPLTDDQFFDWGANAQNQNTYSNQPMYNMSTNAYPAQPTAQPSNQLARRPMSQVIARPPAQNNQWMNESPTTQVQQQDPGTAWSDDIEELMAKAQVAKRDAKSRRKQIPPFVMKLHSFLENPNNTHLIRWSDDGKSFIVLNEDEFANTLIPELFKHSNYASFVRQLNMYGFHKKVGLSDNSMRASERKSKSPSEYWNPFFRKGYPDLLWLIQKPKNQSTSQRNRNQPRSRSEERDEDDEIVDEVHDTDHQRPRPQLTLGQASQSSNNNALTSEQFQTVQRELMMIRRQQGQITQMLGQLKREHDALVDQANDYQDKHSRHEQSINAILTFLATLYHRALPNQEEAQDIAKMFAQTIAGDKSGSGVVDVDNLVYDFPEAASIDQTGKSYKRPRLMITDGSDTRANTLSPSSVASPLARSSRRSSHMARSPQSAHVEEIFDPDTNQPTPKYSSPAGQQQQQDMMSLIHNTNARNSNHSTPVQDFNHVLNDIESSGGSAPVSAAQRENMVRIFNDQARRSQATSNKTALTSPNRTNSQMQFDAKLANTSHDLDNLAQLQAAQDKSVENLTNLLQPLSPTGSIPGIGDGQDVPPPPLNIDDFLNSTHDYFAEFPGEGNGNLDFTNLNNAGYSNNNNNTNNYDFQDDDPLFAEVDDNRNGDNNFLNVNNYDGAQEGGRIESVASSSEAPTPNNEGSDAGDWNNGGGNYKKRRTS